tara:strand:- start:275 stop:841 length:567 start_codon:yes stop_codon:yes gene_type:complete
MSENQIPVVGRNELCPCGSGKKYKRCHGKNAQPQIPPSTLKAQPKLPPGMNLPEGFDPSQLDTGMMNNMMQALQRLPKGQLIKFQQVMQKAMAGQDVTQEMMTLEKTLPPQFQEMMTSMFAGMNMASTIAQSQEDEAAQMDEKKAQEVVKQAVESGQMTKEEAQEILGDQAEAVLNKKKGFFGKLLGK